MHKRLLLSRYLVGQFSRLATALLMGTLVVSPLIAASIKQSEITAASQSIRNEALTHSRIMDYAFYLSDVYGPRLTGSPNFRAAGEWAMRELKEMGMSGIVKDPVDGFGYGWVNTRFSLEMTAPSFAPLIGAPLAWTTATKGPVEGEPVRVDLPSQKLDAATKFIDLQRGKLRGKILLLTPPSVLKLHTTPQSVRWSDSEVAEQVAKAEARTKSTAQPSAGTPRLDMQEIYTVNKMLESFFKEEGVLAMIGDMGDSKMNDGGTFVVQSALLQGNKRVTPGLPPMIVMAADHYNRVVRLANKGIPVRLRLDVGATLIDNPPDAFNVLGEIPGSSNKDEIILVGAHLDSWSGGTGATDNAAGCAVVMEVARILKSLGVPLKRTVRFVLWGGEEQGNLGSISYINKHLVEFKRDVDRPWQFNVGARKAEYEKFSSYYNLDGGTGRIRGVVIGNDYAAGPLFESWLAPVRDLGATAVLPRAGAGSDDASFAAAGLPSFSFLQDPLEYNTRTHHTNMDLYDRLQKDDLIQAAVVVATLVYADANRDVPMPRPTPNRR